VGLRMAVTYDADRFREAVAYIAWKMKDDPSFGRVKLAKTLFYADFEWYAGEGEPLTGATYHHWPYGPFPPILYEVEAELERAGHAKRLHPEFEGNEARLIATHPPEAPHLEDWHKQFLDLKMREVAEHPTWKVSDLSHEHPAWRFTAPKEEIPYAAALVPKPPSARVRTLARRRFEGQGRSGPT
jgi:uncharacterized phage-associated protein